MDGERLSWANTPHKVTQLLPQYTIYVQLYKIFWEGKSTFRNDLLSMYSHDLPFPLWCLPWYSRICSARPALLQRHLSLMIEGFSNGGCQKCLVSNIWPSLASVWAMSLPLAGPWWAPVSKIPRVLPWTGRTELWVWEQTLVNFASLSSADKKSW